MKKLTTLICGAWLVLGSTGMVMAAPLAKARPVVPLPAIGISRQGGAPLQDVSRGSRGLSVQPPNLKGSPAQIPANRLAPQRAQVLGLRHRVQLRYKGQGRGARLAIELP